MLSITIDNRMDDQRQALLLRIQLLFLLILLLIFLLSSLFLFFYPASYPRPIILYFLKFLYCDIFFSSLLLLFPSSFRTTTSSPSPLYASSSSLTSSTFLLSFSSLCFHYALSLTHFLLFVPLLLLPCFLLPPALARIPSSHFLTYHACFSITPSSPSLHMHPSSLSLPFPPSLTMSPPSLIPHPTCLSLLLCAFFSIPPPALAAIPLSLITLPCFGRWTDSWPDGRYLSPSSATEEASPQLMKRKSFISITGTNKKRRSKMNEKKGWRSWW